MRTNGKPPGVNPAAPMRQRSCRGAGSTAATEAPDVRTPAEIAEVTATEIAAAAAEIATIAAITAIAQIALAAEVAAIAEITSAAHAAERGEPALLIVVEALVERIGGLGELLQRHAGFGHRGAAAPQPLGRIDVRSLWIALLRHAGAEAIEAQLLHIARRLFERRPVLLLLWRQREPCPQRGRTRIGQRAHVLDIRAARKTLGPPVALLRVGERRGGNRQRSRAGEKWLPHRGSPSESAALKSAKVKFRVSSRAS